MKILHKREKARLVYTDKNLKRLMYIILFFYLN